MQRNLDSVDEQAIRAMQRVVDDFVSASEVSQIKQSYRASDLKDAYWIAWDCHLHPYVVIAVLRNLDERGELPAHPSWW
jgi:glycine/D-amino acid oxidase-like deaminating enzyme